MSTGRTETEQVRVHIRWMIRRDMPEVLQTEQASFDFSWTEEDFLRCLRQRNCIGMVAEQGEKVVGFMIYELHKAKLHILNFAVHPTCRRFGIGAQMIAKLISKLSSHRRTKITLEVRETNLCAQLFFRSQGFLALRVLKSHYEDSGEDAFLMQYQLANDASEDTDDAVNRIASTKRTELESSQPDPAGADAARWDRLTGRRGSTAPRTSSIISNRPGVLVLSTLLIVAFSSTLILSNADVSRRRGDLSLQEAGADSKFKGEGKTGLGEEFRALVKKGESEIAAIVHPKIPKLSHEALNYRAPRQESFGLQQIDYRPSPLFRTDAENIEELLKTPRDEHPGVGPMIRDIRHVSFFALVAGAMMHGSVAAALMDPSSADDEKLAAIQKDIKELGKTVGEVNKVLADLRTLRADMKADLKFGLEQMGGQVTNIALDQSVTQKNVNEMREELSKLRTEVETLRTRMQTNTNRASLYPNDAATTDSSTARVEMINTYTNEVAFVINRRTYYVAPGQTRTSDPIPAGTFTYEVLGIQAPTTRTVGPNKIFTVRVYPL